MIQCPPDDRYASGAVLALIDSPRVTKPTATALRARAEPVVPPDQPILSKSQLAMLAAVAARLIPQPRSCRQVDLAGRVHQRLADGTGVGWRHADLPPVSDLQRIGLAALNACSLSSYQCDFISLRPWQQDALLGKVQRGSTAYRHWRDVDQRLWFEETLAILVEVYFAHPIAQDAMGYAGMADADGWPEVGLGAREAYEPPSLRSSVRALGK